MPGAHCVAKGCLGQETGGMMCIFDIGNRDGSIRNAIIDNSINWYRYTVFGEHLNVAKKAYENDIYESIRIRVNFGSEYGHKMNIKF